MLSAGYGNKEGKGILRAGYENKMKSFNKVLKYKNIIKINLDLREFILEIVCLKNKE